MQDAAWWSVLQGNPSTPIRIATCACERKRGLAANPLSPIRAHVNTPYRVAPGTTHGVMVPCARR